jgi:hypothetical protein
MTRLLLAAAISVGLAGDLRGQDVGAFRAVGQVRDSAGNPVPRATVATALARTETDSLGKFTLRLTRTDSTTVTVRRLGFESVTFTMLTDSLALNNLDIQLEGIVRDLPEVAVKEERVGRVPSLERFDERRRDRAGFGTFLTREQIVQREGMALSSLLQQANGVTIVRQKNGRNLLRFTRWSSKGRNCVPHTWVDGAIVREFEIDDVRAADVEAVEIYPSAASAPPEFDVGNKFGCGVVVLWTRRPILKTR